MSLPMAKPERNWDRYNALWAEVKFRRKAIFRIYPEARIQGSHGPFWDMGGPASSHVRIGDTLYYDHELTLLSRAIDAEMYDSLPVREENTKEWPLHDHPIVQQNQFFDLLVSAACVDELWERDDIQDLYANMMGKQPLDRIVEAINAAEAE